MVVGVAHDLQSLSLLLEIDEDKVFALLPDVGDSSSEGSFFIEPLSLHADGIVFLDKLGDCDLDVEFMGIRICVWVLFEFIDHLGPVFEVLSGIKDLLLLLSWLVLGLSCPLCRLISLLLLEPLLLVQPLQLIFAQFCSIYVSLDLLNSGLLLCRLRDLLNFICLHNGDILIIK